MINPGSSAQLNRYGQHSMFFVAAGAARIETTDGEVIVNEINPQQEEFIMANRGDLIIRSIGETAVEIRPPLSPVPVPPMTPPVKSKFLSEKCERYPDV